MRPPPPRRQCRGLGWVTPRVPDLTLTHWGRSPPPGWPRKYAGAAWRRRGQAKQGGALPCVPEGALHAPRPPAGREPRPREALPLFFLRLLLLFFPGAAEHSERTEELWMLALSKSDSSRSSSSLCRGARAGVPGSACEPQAWPGGSPEGGARGRLRRHSALWGAPGLSTR